MTKDEVRTLMNSIYPSSNPISRDEMEQKQLDWVKLMDHLEKSEIVSNPFESR